MKVIIVGGGASGMMAAIYAAKQNNDVTIIEKNKVLGKKILVTGNGKCNYYNENQNISHYHTSNFEKLKQILTDENKKELLTFLDLIGIVPKIKNGYYYPNSNQAVSVQTAFIKEIELLNIKVLLEEDVEDISYGNKFIVKTNKRKVEADKVIIATGSFATLKNIDEFRGYDFSKKFGHKVIKPLPALVGLIGNDNYYKDWTGIRTDVKLNLYIDNNLISEEYGEIQLTNIGISGICVFQLSAIVARNIEENIKQKLTINFLPFLNSNEEFIKWMNNRNNLVKNRTIQELLDGVLNYKLVNLILKLSNINRDDYWNNIDSSKKIKLSSNLLYFNFDVKDTNSYSQAQICSGGVPLNEINPKNMESLKQKNLHFTGELLDVDGECGGYNLEFAFITGMLAGKGDLND